MTNISNPTTQVNDRPWWAAPLHVHLSPHDRAELHALLGRLHELIYRGDSQGAGLVARLAADHVRLGAAA